MENTFKLQIIDNNTYIQIYTNIILSNNYYKISFTYDFSPDIDTSKKKIKLLKYFGLYDSDIQDYYQGDIIFKNSFTEQLISYLLLNDDNLKTKTGNLDSQSYRLSLIRTIQLLWT